MKRIIEIVRPKHIEEQDYKQYEDFSEPKVLIVGDKPSTKNTHANVAFEGTASGKKLKIWKEFWGSYSYKVVNSVDITYADELQYYILNGWPVLVLGKLAASRTLVILGKRKRHAPRGAQYHEYNKINDELPPNIMCIPHPSGLNRLLNNKEFEQRFLTAAKEFIEQTILRLGTDHEKVEL